VSEHSPDRMDEVVAARRAKLQAMPDCRCGHPATHHDAGECWTNPDGTETWDDPDDKCLCGGYEPIEAGDAQ
jgi:hypothetical protein